LATTGGYPVTERIPLEREYPHFCPVRLGALEYPTMRERWA